MLNSGLQVEVDAMTAWLWLTVKCHIAKTHNCLYHSYLMTNHQSPTADWHRSPPHFSLTLFPDWKWPIKKRYLKCHNRSTVHYIVYGQTSAVVSYTSIGHCPTQSFVHEPSDLSWPSLYSILSPVSDGTCRMLHAQHIQHFICKLFIFSYLSVCLWPFIRVVHKKVLI
jgi:hypothetical protein